MREFLVIFFLAAAGSLVRVSCAFLLGALAAASGPRRAGAPAILTDPVVIFSCTLAGYGAIALTVVCWMPGPSGLARTALAFAILCVGGLISEISNTGTTGRLPNLDSPVETQPRRYPISRGLSLALSLVLNLTFAVLGYGQGLSGLVPDPGGLAAPHGSEAHRAPARAAAGYPGSAAG